MVSSQSFASSVVCLAYITFICSVQHFPGSHSLHLSFGSFFFPIHPPFILPLINQCHRCLVPLAWGLMAGRCRFASHRGMTLSSSCVCHRWKPLDIPGHSPPLVTQLLIWVMEMGRVGWAPSIGSVHIHLCQFPAVDWSVPMCDKRRLQTCRLAGKRGKHCCEML